MAALVAIAGPGAANAGAIINTAEARWSLGEQAVVAPSNTVTIEVAPITSHVAVLPLPADGASTRDLTAGMCQRHPLPASRVGADALSEADPGSIETLKIGQPILFRLQVSRAVLDPAKIDTLDVTLTSASGDRELVTVSETGRNTGIFLGAVPTSAIPPEPVSSDCRLSVSQGDRITITYRNTAVDLTAQASVGIVADPFGLVFDSEDGHPVDGVRVTLVDAVTGAPAVVLADDGITSWPSSVVTGQNVIDGSGRTWPMPAGEYRFPLTHFGTYRLKIEPPADYTAPSKFASERLGWVVRPDGGPVELVAASFGGPLTLSGTAPVRVDVPIDRPPVAVMLAKAASRQVAQPGDAVFYTVTVRNTDTLRAKRDVILTDRPAPALRLRPNTLRINGKAPATGAVTTSGDGRILTINLGAIAPDATVTITYAMVVQADAAAGNALNRIEAVDSRGLGAVAQANVRVERDNLASTMTLIGRISTGDCSVAGPRQGVPGVRVMLEDGSFAVSDAEGRYHFEGLAPGSHVVAAQQDTLPEGSRLVDCAASTRSAGSAVSRFVKGQGGSLVVVDFSAIVPQSAVLDRISTDVIDDGRAAAGGETDWLALGDGETGFLFPQADHNPRAPTIRVVVRHRAHETAVLRVDGAPVDALAFDGVKTSSVGYAVSIWRGIPLTHEDTRLEADIRGPDGGAGDTVVRTVHFGTTPARVELVPERSRLVADGRTRPVIAVRVLDRSGHPVHAGLSGQFSLSAPYESAEALDAMQSRMLAGLERAAPAWTVKGDDGVALIELAPTMVSGGLDLTFQFADRDVKRQQVVEAWVAPGAQKWTLVGLAEGALGARSVADQMQRDGTFDSDLGENARVAFYAKGRVMGSVLATIAYDSAKQRNEQLLLGGLDPKAYYTIFADGSERRYDAASVGKLYVRIESDRVRALFGDFSTGFDHTQLARYERTMNGARAEARLGKVRVEGFAAKTATTHRRDQLPGAGISGPYRLSSRAMIPNSETVTIEVRDRFRSELVLSSEVLARFIDYDVDTLSGTITFKRPILSRDGKLNPQTIVVDYEIDTLRAGAWNAGVRSEWHGKGERVRIGASAITDAGAAGDGSAQGRTNLAALDARVRLVGGTELRAEASVSKARAGAARTAFLIEGEHHDARLDILAYIRALDADFGLGQASVGELGRRKVGVDGRYALSQAWSITASAAWDDSLVDASHRDLVQLRSVWTSQGTEAHFGFARYGERSADGADAVTNLVEAGVTRRLLDNRLELSGAASLALGGNDSSSYQPPRYRAGARYAVTHDIRLVGDYEIAKGEIGESRTLRAGLELSPWSGARIATTLGQQRIAEQGKRAFAAYGLAQSLPVGQRLTIDLSLDGNRMIGAGEAVTSASTAQVGSSSTNQVVEDFTAYTFGASWRSGRWSASARAEMRDGAQSRRRGLTMGAIRQIGEGSIVGAGLTLTDAHDDDGGISQVASFALAMAHRPADGPFAFLAKADLRSDKVVSGTRGDSETALDIDGDARSRRLVASFSGNWAPLGRSAERQVQRTEVGMFAAVRQNLDSYQGTDLCGTTVMGGLDLRIGLGESVELGGSATARQSLSEGTTSFAVGPQVGVAPAKNAMIVIGYNVEGFRDRDFGEARTTTKGVFATLQMKFDSNTLAALGLGR